MGHTSTIAFPLTPRLLQRALTVMLLGVSDYSWQHKGVSSQLRALDAVCGAAGTLPDSEWHHRGRAEEGSLTVNNWGKGIGTPQKFSDTRETWDKSHTELVTSVQWHHDRKLQQLLILAGEQIIGAVFIRAAC